MQIIRQRRNNTPTPWMKVHLKTKIPVKTGWKFDKLWRLDEFSKNFHVPYA